MLRLIDDLLDRVSSRLAENLTENMEIAAKNRAARELSELPEARLRQAGVARRKLDQGGAAYPWCLSHDQSTEKMEQLVREIQNTKSHPLHDKKGFLA